VPPPAGSGECAAPKLFQYAYEHDFKPIAMAEFWWGASPKSEVRKHKQFYPSCRSKCEPILGHMMQGLDVEDNPIQTVATYKAALEIVYEDDYLLLVNKPPEFLSVPGKHIQESVLTRMKRYLPKAKGPLLVHRLDMSTSGLLLVAKNEKTHKNLQKQFIARTIKKRYVALLDGEILTKTGVIDLPLRVDLDNRPQQLVCYTHGKPAKTNYEVVDIVAGKTRIHFYPVSGRTHQLRVHAAHVDGLNMPIALLLLNTLVCVSQAIAIRYNQIGYFNDRGKVINLVANTTFSPLAFTVLDVDDNVVLSGTSAAVNYWSDAQEYVSKIDVSSITTAGTYRLQAGGEEVSFNIDVDVYQAISDASLKYYYYNRASTAISSTYGSMGHPDTSVRVHSSAASPARPTNTIISSPKGWYDAGDYNKYIVNSGISTYTLLAAFERFENYYKVKAIDIPETGGNLPDLLDEVKWNLDWMLTMQEPSDGGVYHKLTGLNFSGRIMPNAYTATRYVINMAIATLVTNFNGLQ